MAKRKVEVIFPEQGRPLRLLGLVYANEEVFCDDSDEDLRVMMEGKLSESECR